MRSTGQSRDERIVAATLALAVNGLIAWALMALLTPDTIAIDDAASLQVIWIEAPAARRVAVRSPTRGHDGQARAAQARDPSRRAQPQTPTPAMETAPEITPTRSMSAVYLQQARQWSQAQAPVTPPADPFANRRVALRDQAGSRFRLAHSSPAATVAKQLGKFFGGAGYATDDCGAIDERLLGLVVAGDDRAVQQDLDYERRNCRR